MKKIILLFIVIALGGQLNAQTVSPDQLDQIKRMARRNNHITKTYEGTVEKLLYSFQSLGGPLNGLIFRKADGKLTYIRFYEWYGKSFKPFLQEGKKTQITVSGDPVLLDVLIYRDDYLREMEFSMKEEIFGMGILQAAKNENGSISVETMNKDLLQNRFWNRVTNVYNAQVKSKVELNKSEYLINLENGDSLLLAKASINSLKEIPEKISYVKKVRDKDDPNYYKNSKVFPIYTGKSDQILMYQYGVLMYHNRLLNIQRVTVDEYVPENNGLVESVWVRNQKDKRILLRFDGMHGQKVKSLLANGLTTVHLMPLESSWRILGIEDNGSVVEIDRRTVGRQSEYFEKELSTTEGKITELFLGSFQGIERYTGAIIDNKVYINIPDYTGISIGKGINVGDDVSIEGYRKSDNTEEYRLKKYEIYYPKTISIGRKTYEVKGLFRNGL